MIATDFEACEVVEVRLDPSCLPQDGQRVQFQACQTYEMNLAEWKIGVYDDLDQTIHEDQDGFIWSMWGEVRRWKNVISC